jgi:hypothetical protein
VDASKVPNFLCSMESRQLADWLIERGSKKDHKEIVTYEELEKAAGVDVRQKRHILQTARAIAIREAGVDYATVNKQGIMLLDSTGVVGVGESVIGRVRRCTTKVLKRLAWVEFDTLSESDKIRHNANASFIGVMRILTGKSSRKRIEGAVAATQSKLPVKETFKLFSAAPNSDE